LNFGSKSLPLHFLQLLVTSNKIYIQSKSYVIGEKIGIGKKIKEKVAGKTIKEYDEFEQRALFISKVKYHTTLKEIDNKYWVIIRLTMGPSIQWFELTMDNVQKLRDILDDTLNTSFKNPIGKNKS